MKKKSIAFLIISIIFITISPPIHCQSNENNFGDLTIIISGLRSDSRNVQIGLFNSKDSWNNKKDKFKGAEIKLNENNKNLVIVETPFFLTDGDPYQIYLKEMPNGIMRLTDMGHTMMHFSYENEVDKFREWTRGKYFIKYYQSHQSVKIVTNFLLK